MIGLILAIIIFNLIAFKHKENLTLNQVLHIWAFTIAFQNSFDLFIDFKYHGYWYFTKEVDWKALPAHLLLLPPVNIVFLNGYPFKKKIRHKIGYLVIWVMVILIYETITRLPEPWGYFDYGWWELWHSAIVDPILFLTLLAYYKWIRKAENKLLAKNK
ncbi:hypothetical protein ACQKGA_26250 [Priestia megaterium]|uniref:hypothetical protein n=1 Tax=Priestia megaterium TaxID=1404 RepID=UPI000BA7113B|nr:hypothetical protein [Priestia megaterium]PAK41452.1 hypothetical protein CHH47_29105 [Priestia megaterium]